MVHAFSQSIWYFWYKAYSHCLLYHPTLIRLLICGAHRWEIKYTYLQDIYCIVKPWIQRNKSIRQIKMCMCGEWMVYGDDGDNNGESLILLLLFWGDTYLSCYFETFEENEMLYILFFFPLRWVSCTPSSTIGHLSIFTSRLTFSFLRGSEHLPLFISSYLSFFLSIFLEHSSLEIM